MVKHIPSIHEALGLTSSTAKISFLIKKKGKKKNINQNLSCDEYVREIQKNQVTYTILNPYFLKCIIMLILNSRSTCGEIQLCYPQDAN